MDIRAVEAADSPAIRDVARRSLGATYPLEEETIITAIDKWYGDDEVQAKATDDHHVFLAVAVDDRVVAFSESEFGESGEGNLLWLNVDPAFRGQGIGSELYERTVDRLRDLGADHLHARVLAENERGNEFYRDRGFEQVGSQTVDIAGRKHVENLYAEADSVGFDEHVTDDETVYVSREETDTGSLDVFHVVYSDPEGEHRYGYYCGNCGSLATAMDAMGRVECGDCGNVRKPTRWDAAYL